jgi:drug/metabolite transporter (DMT)-like permease
LTPLSILLIFISALFHSSWNFFTKRRSWSMEFFFWVFLSGIVLFLPFFAVFGAFPSIILQAPLEIWWIAILSGILETAYFVCLTMAYQRGDLSFVYPISRSAPLFTQIWAVLFIGEILSKVGVLGIILVMVGLFVVSMKELSAHELVSFSYPSDIRPCLLALGAALASSIYSVIDKLGVQILHPVFYIWLVNLWMCAFTGGYLVFRGVRALLKLFQTSKRDILIVAVLQNAAYLLVLLALQMSKVSYVVAFRQVGALFGAILGVTVLKESSWKTRITGAVILTFGLILIGLA